MMVEKGDSGRHRWTLGPVTIALLTALVGAAVPAAAAAPTATFSWNEIATPHTIRASCVPSDPDGTPSSCTWFLQGFDRNSPFSFGFFAFSNDFTIELHRWAALDLCFALTVTVEDSDGETTIYEDPIDPLPTCTPANTAPTISLGEDTWKLPAKAFVLEASIADPDAGDTHTLTIDWGDGTSETLAAAPGTVAATHAYRGTGTWTIQACVQDAAGEASCDTLTLEQRGAEDKLPADKLPGKGKAHGLR